MLTLIKPELPKLVYCRTISSNRILLQSIIWETLLKRLVFESQELGKPVASFKVLFCVRLCCPQAVRKVLARNLEFKEPSSLHRCNQERVKCTHTHKWFFYSDISYNNLEKELFIKTLSIK